MKLPGFLQKRRPQLLGAAALTCGGLAAFGARGYIDETIANEKARLVPRQETVQVVVARTDLRGGDQVSADTMAVRAIPKDFVPSTAIRPERFEALVGSRLSTSMRSGEPLLAGLVDGGEVSTFSTKVRAGIRALTIAVDEINSISGMLQPGDRIDLLWSIKPTQTTPGSGPRAELTAPLMQDLLVLATGRQVRPAGADGTAPRTFTAITVEVSPDQAQKLVVAQRNGKLTATLRNPNDRTPAERKSMDIEALLGLRNGTLERALPEVIHGGQGTIARNSGGR